MSNHRPPERTAAIRAAVLSASTGLFLEQGYSRTTIRDISRASGISSGTIMKVMKSKEDILAELVAFVLESQFAATEKALAGMEYDPILFYAAETTFQLYIAESSEHIRNLYATAYSLPKTTEIIQNTITDKLVTLFGVHLPELSREDFYLREIASGGIMRDFMARPCGGWLTMEVKVRAFLETTFLVYRVPDAKIQEAIRFVSQFDYPSFISEAIRAMLADLGRSISEQHG